MSAITESIFKKGYIPLACDGRGAIAWRGEYIKGFWMWNRQFTRYRGGIRHIQTIKVEELKEAALRYWRDGWVPVKPVDEPVLRRLEEALRCHQGLKKEGVKFPDGPFLQLPEAIPEEHLGPEVRVYLGLPRSKSKKLVRVGKVSKKVIEAYKRARQGGGL